MEEKIIGNVNETYEYEKFKLILGNRNVSSVKKILKSIDNVGQLRIPIIVNEKYEIIDGQHRYQAWKERNLPIYYTICEGYGIKECIAMNTTSENWKSEDYINCYAEYGYFDYIALRAFENRYSGKLSKMVIRMAAAGNYGKSNADAIKNGTFKLAMHESEVEKELEFLSMFDIPKTLRGNAQLIYYILRFCYECEEVDNAKLYKQWQECGSQVQGITDIKSAAEAVEKIYNYRCSKKCYVYIATEYRKVAEQKCSGKVGGGKSAWDK